MFEVMLFPVLRFVAATLSTPVMRTIMDPSAALRILLYWLSIGQLIPIGNPQKSAGRVNGSAGRISHLGPRPASAGPAVISPATMPTSAPSATIIAGRLIATPPPIIATAHLAH
jgi:hypothetical protein